MRPLIAIAVVIILLYVGKEYVFDADESPRVVATSRNAGGALEVDVYVAEETDSENTIYASGTLVANEEVSLQSEISGRVLRLNITEGSYVTKGSVIAKIDDRDLQAQLRKLNFEEELAQQTEARQKKLLDIDAISKEEYDLSLNRVSTLSADRDLLEVQIGRTSVRAPFSGYIGLKNISVGAYLTPGIPIATIVQTNPIKIDFTIPEKYASLVKKGEKVTFAVDGHREDYAATILAIDPKVDEDLRTLRVRAKTGNPDRMLLPGMFVRLTVPLGTEKTIVIPTESIVPILKGKMVYVVKQGKAQSVEITTGVRNDQHVQVRDGLSIGDSVVVSALMSVKPGAEIKIDQVVNQKSD